MTKDVLVLVANGFEDTELIATLDVFSRENLNYDLVSVENKLEAVGAYNAWVKTKVLKDTNVDDYQVLFIPGGKGYKTILETQGILEIVRVFDKKSKLITAICAAPEILFQAGVLKKTFTSYPGFAKSPNNTGNELEVCENTITGRDFECSIKFAKEVVKTFKKL